MKASGVLGTLSTHTSPAWVGRATQFSPKLEVLRTWAWSVGRWRAGMEKSTLGSGRRKKRPVWRHNGKHLGVIVS